MNEPKSSARQNSERASAGHTRRVLLVEDNLTNQRVMRRLLENMRCEVELASNGREALDRLVNRRFDLIFMDCHMPVMDGYDTTEEIRRTESVPPPLPIVAVTASICREDHERCLRVGMNQVLTKPVNPEDIAAALDRWCRRNDTTSPGTNESSETRMSP